MTYHTVLHITSLITSAITCNHTKFHVADHLSHKTIQYQHTEHIPHRPHISTGRSGHRPLATSIYHSPH